MPSSHSRKAPPADETWLAERFDDFVAVDGIDVEVRPGESFGFKGALYACSGLGCDGGVAFVGVEDRRYRLRTGVIYENL